MNKSCNGMYGQIFYSSGMTLSDLHYDEDKVSKVFKEIMDEDEKYYNKEKYYNGEKKDTSIKMK